MNLMHRLVAISVLAAAFLGPAAFAQRGGGGGMRGAATGRSMGSSAFHGGGFGHAGFGRPGFAGAGFHHPGIGRPGMGFPSGRGCRPQHFGRSVLDSDSAILAITTISDLLLETPVGPIPSSAAAIFGTASIPGM